MNFLKSLKNYLDYLKTAKAYKDKKCVYIYSEGLNYRNYFIEIINSLNKKNIKVFYFTSDPKDLELISENTKPIFIGSGFIRILFFTTLKCKFMLMTLTDLNNHEIKRSKTCGSYGYIFHSLVSAHKSYTKNSFNNYDLIFANGEYHKKELIKLEELNKSKKKKIYTTGYSYLDFLTKKKNNYNKFTDNILFAPSWAKYKEDLLEKYGIDIIREVSKKTKITLRVHPQSLIKSKSKITEIEKTFSGNENFKFNRNIFDITPFFESKLLITDNGGIALEYAYINRKPVVFIDYKNKVHNEEFSKINLEPIEDAFRRKFGLVVPTNKIQNLNTIINQTIDKYQKLQKKKEIDDFFNENKIYFQNASDNISKIIEKELNLQ